MDVRYSRQTRFAPIGEDGQRRLGDARVTLIGCGALGTHLADHLVRAGVGFVRICDRDFVDLHNLQRQVLFDEDDVEAAMPKAVAAARKLARVNHNVTTDPRVLDVSSDNIESLIEDVDLVLDGTDELRTRFLINEASVSTGRPWVYGGCVGSRGMVLPVIPGQTPCFACLLPASSGDGDDLETCETAGVISPAVAVVAAPQSAEAMKILTGKTDDLLPGLLTLDVWENEYRALKAQRDPACRICVERRFERIGKASADGNLATRLCGGNAVRLTPADPVELDLEALEAKLAADGTVRRNDYLLRFTTADRELLVFADGRAVVKGTEDLEEARRHYEQHVTS